MPAAQFNITIEPGATFELPLRWFAASTPVNISYQARFNLRPSKDRSPILVSSTQNGGAASTPLTGELYFLLTPAQTSSITFHKGYYEVEIYSTQATPYVKKLLKGIALVDRT